MDITVLLPPIVILGGLYMLFKLKFFFLRHPFNTLRRLCSSFGEKSARRSLSLALAGTLGIGNIVGVAVGIIVGGAGSVFWLIFSSLFATVLKYSESALAADFKLEGHGGMALVIKNSFSGCGGMLSALYAFFCLLLSFVMGAALQTATAAECAGAALQIPRSVFGVFFVLLVFLSVVGGARRIERITSVIIPIATAVYIFLALGSIVIHFPRIPAVISHIFSSAFSPESIGGGIVGFFISLGMREGFARGLLSNEAGAGTSSMAHSRSELLPAAVGLFGMCEVFFDTVLLCTLTAVAILAAVPDPSAYSTGMTLVFDGIGSVFGRTSECLLLFSIFAFAYSTVICWYYYGSECKNFLLGKRFFVFLPLFLTAIYIGSVFKVNLFVYAADYILLVLTVLSLSAVIKNSDRIVTLSENFELIIPRS